MTAMIMEATVNNIPEVVVVAVVVVAASHLQAPEAKVATYGETQEVAHFNPQSFLSVVDPT